MTDTATVELTDTPEEAEFRARVRAFLEQHCRRRGAEADLDAEEMDGDERVAAAKRYQRALADAGLAGLTYPKEYGGAGLTKRHQEIFDQEASKFLVPTWDLTISHGMCLPVLNQFGTTEQKERFLRPIITAEQIWCQMFSEPGAGSDVASLQTRAVRDGDEWVINGQKVWTSGAHYCDYGLCLARTDPDVPKHEGISMFIVDMKAPGVEIRPLRQISGGSHFNEIFLTDVRIPADWLVGDLNRGWNVAVAMLMYERVAIGAGGSGPMSSGRFGALLEEARARGLASDPVVRQELADLYAREQIQRFIGMRIRAAVESGREPGPEGSIAKLNSANLSYLARDLSMRILGARGQAWLPDDDTAEDWAMGAVSSMAVGIAGGTNEIQRNIIGERVLGLPKEPSVDRGVPFKDLLVGTQR